MMKERWRVDPSRIRDTPEIGTRETEKFESMHGFGRRKFE